MNRERARELLPTIQAFAEGRDIECKGYESLKWFKIIVPDFDDNKREFRIKPEPFECWVVCCANGLFGTYLSEEGARDAVSLGATNFFHMREVES